MKIRSMRSVLFLFLCCIMLGLVSCAVSAADLQSVGCTDDSYPGLPGESVIAVVYVSGSGNTFIDGLTLTPAGNEPVQGYDANWYAVTPGTHQVLITNTGYINYIANMLVCKGKVSYVYYDKEARPALGTTTKEKTATTVPTTTIVTTTVTTYGQSSDLGAVKGALGTKVPAESLGSLSVSTDPEGAAIYIDGVQVGVSPATIPGISAGTHTLLLKREGYQDLSLPVVISAGKTHTYSSAMLKSGGAGAMAGATTTRKSSMPGFMAVLAACGAIVLFLAGRKRQ